MDLQWLRYKVDYGEAPPKPRFQENDSDYCQTHVKEYFDSAYNSWKTEDKNTAKLNASYTLILDAQVKYGVELTNNKDFAYWAISDYEETWCYENGDPKPEFSDSFVALFGDGATKVKPLRNID